MRPGSPPPAPPSLRNPHPTLNPSQPLGSLPTDTSPTPHLPCTNLSYCTGERGERGWVMRWGGGHAVGRRGVGGVATLGRGRRARHARGARRKSARFFVDSVLPVRAVCSSVRESVFPNRALHGVCVFCTCGSGKKSTLHPLSFGTLGTHALCPFMLRVVLIRH